MVRHLAWLDTRAMYFYHSDLTSLVFVTQYNFILIIYVTSYGHQTVFL